MYAVGSPVFLVVSSTGLPKLSPVLNAVIVRTGGVRDRSTHSEADRCPAQPPATTAMLNIQPALFWMTRRIALNCNRGLGEGDRFWWIGPFKSVTSGPISVGGCFYSEGRRADR